MKHKQSNNSDSTNNPINNRNNCSPFNTYQYLVHRARAAHAYIHDREVAHLRQNFPPKTFLNDGAP